VYVLKNTPAYYSSNAVGTYATIAGLALDASKI
jgi:hypothetical protein